MVRSEVIYVDYFDKEFLDRDRKHRDKYAYDDSHYTDNSVKYQLAYGDGYSSEHHGFSQKKNFYDMTLDLFKFLRSVSAVETSYELEFLYGKEHITRKEKNILEEIISLHNDFTMPKRRRNITKRPEI